MNYARRSMHDFWSIAIWPRPIPKNKREYARIIYRSGRHLLAVVNAIMDLSIIRPAPWRLRSSLCGGADDRSLLRHGETFMPRTMGWKLLRAYAANLDEITGDRRGCTQILVNLLSNAIKFTPAKGA